MLMKMTDRERAPAREVPGYFATSAERSAALPASTALLPKVREALGLPPSATAEDACAVIEKFKEKIKEKNAALLSTLSATDRDICRKLSIEPLAFAQHRASQRAARAMAESPSILSASQPSALTDEEREICKKLSMDPREFAEHKRELARRASQS